MSSIGQVPGNLPNPGNINTSGTSQSSSNLAGGSVTHNPMAQSPMAHPKGMPGKATRKKLSSRKKNKDSKSDKAKGKENKAQKQKGIAKVAKSRDPRRQQQDNRFIQTLKNKAKLKQLTSLLDIIDLAKSSYDDITHAYEGIRTAQEELAAEAGQLDPELQNLEESCLAAGNTFFSDPVDGPDIRAGLILGNITDPESLEAYRRIVLRFKKLSESFKEAIKFAKHLKKFKKFLQQLISHVGMDLSAQESTVDPEQLRSIREELYKLQLLEQTLRDVEYMVRDIEEGHDY